MYYDLLEEKVNSKRTDVAIVRLEQLYPLAQGQLTAVLKKYSKAKVLWVQEEPINMGAWEYILRSLYKKVDVDVIAREEAASPAVGYLKTHLETQRLLVEQAFSA